MLKTTLSFIALSFLSFSQVADLRLHTQNLCSKEMHGRGYVNSGDSIAAAYLEKNFFDLGVRTFPDKSSYFQPFTFDVNCFPGQMRVVVNGRKLEPGKDFIVKPNSGSYKNAFGTISVTGVDLFDTRYMTTTYNMIKNSRGKLGLALNFEGLKGDSLKIAQEKAEKFMNIGPVIEIDKNKFTWSVAREAKEYPYIHVRDSLYEEGKWFVEIENEFKLKHKAKNVIAYIPAKKKSDKTVFFTAHYDHLGQMGHDTYFPGANDNASGTAMLLTLAKYFKENPPNFNIVFIAFAGEEAGLIGSKYFVDNPWMPLTDITFVVNLDIMGSGEEGITVVNATLYPKAFKKLLKINNKEKLLTQIKSRGPAANSDHYFFSEAGVPAFFIYTMGPNKHYHDIYDTHSELSFAESEDITVLLRLFLEKIK